MASMLSKFRSSKCINLNLSSIQLAQAKKLKQAKSRKTVKSKKMVKSRRMVRSKEITT